MWTSKEESASGKKAARTARVAGEEKGGQWIQGDWQRDGEEWNEEAFQDGQR